MPGFLKTLAQEWPGVRVKAVDLSPTAPEDGGDPPARRAPAGDGIIEVGYRRRRADSSSTWLRFRWTTVPTVSRSTPTRWSW